MARSHGGYSSVKSNLEPRSGPRIFVGKLNKETTENDVKVQGVLTDHARAAEECMKQPSVLLAMTQWRDPQVECGWMLRRTTSRTLDM